MQMLLTFLDYTQSSDTISVVFFSYVFVSNLHNAQTIRLKVCILTIHTDTILLLSMKKKM